MDYRQIIQYLFPTAIYGTDYVLYFQAGSLVPSLYNWNTAKLGTQPTIDVLQQAWASVLVAQAKTAQLAVIAQASADAQTTGFTSSALGSAYTYPSGVADQANLTSVIVASMIPGQPAGTTYLFWCADSTGKGDFVAHTASQIQKVGLDGMAMIMAAKQKQLALDNTIEAATTVEAVQAVVW